MSSHARKTDPNTLAAAVEIGIRLEDIPLPALPGSLIEVPHQEKVENWAVNVALKYWATRTLPQLLAKEAHAVAFGPTPDPSDVNKILADIISNPFQVRLMHPGGELAGHVESNDVQTIAAAFSQFCATAISVRERLARYPEEFSAPNAAVLSSFIEQLYKEGSRAQLSKTDLTTDDLEIVLLARHHFDCLARRIRAAVNGFDDLKEPWAGLSDYQRIEQIALSVETALKSEGLLLDGSIELIADCVRVILLTTDEYYGEELTRPRVLRESFVFQDGSVMGLLVVIDGKVIPGRATADATDPASMPYFHITSTPLTFHLGAADDRPSFDRFLDHIEASLEESLARESELSKHEKAEFLKAYVIDIISSYHSNFGRILESAQLAGFDFAEVTSDENIDLASLIKQAHRILNAFREDIEQLTDEDAVQFGAILDDFRMLKEYPLSFMQVCRLAVMWVDMSGAKVWFNPSSHYTVDTFTAEYKELLQIQEALTEHRRPAEHVFSMLFYHTALSLLNDQGRDSFKELLKNGSILVDDYRLMPLEVLNHVPLEQLRQQMKQGADTHSADVNPIRFADSVWFRWMES